MKYFAIFKFLLFIIIFIPNYSFSEDFKNKSNKNLTFNLVNSPQEKTQFFIKDLPSNIINEPIEKNNWSFSVRHQGGNVIDNTFKQSFLSLKKTGLNLDKSINIFGNINGSFFRSYYNNFESNIDTSSFPYQKIIGAGPHSVVAYTFDYKPTVLGTHISGDFLIPSLETKGDSVGQLSIIGYMTDGISTVAFVFCIFDNRYDYFEPLAMTDHSVSFVTQPIHLKKYSTPYKNEKMQKKPFNNWKSYGIYFSKENLSNMIGDLNDFNKKNNIPLISKNPELYKFTLIGVLHEVFLLDNPNNIIKSGVSFKNLQIFKLID